ncbi:MAG: DedA family protein [Hellea sp.]|nr:DedA family protein [Hellea sp.]
MFKKQLEKVINAAGSIYALWVLGIVSFLESAFLPVPVDAFSVPVMLASRKRLWQAAIVASAASVAGGCLGYFIGAVLADSVGAWIINSYGLEMQFETFKSDVSKNGDWVIAMGALTPIPYKIIAIAAGVVKYSFAWFFLISAVCRTLRFFMFAVLIYFAGPKINALLRERTGLMTTLIITVTLAGFLALYFLR